MNVADQLAHVSIRLTKDRLVPPLEYMAHILIFPIVILAVPLQHSLHHLADRLRLTFDQEMKVVRHQTVCIEIKG